ncbi:MAG: ABC transporter permease [Sphaerochaetaceae bacterium]
MKNIVEFFRRRKISGAYLILIGLSLLLFLLVDVFKINNYSGSFLFLTGGNIANVLCQSALYAIIGFGMTMVIIIAGIDLSVGSILALSGVLLSLFMVNYGMPLVFAILITLVIAFLIGAFQGYLIEKFSLPAFVITLGGMILFRGIALLLVDGTPIFNAQKSFVFIGNGTFLGIQLTVYILIFFFLIFHYLLKYSQFGRFVYAIGGNEEAARLSGVNIMRVKVLIHGLTSFAAAVSGIILSSRLGSGQPLAGNGWELYVITAVIIGGTSMSGGVGTISNTLAGALIYGLINNGMNFLNISPYHQWIIRGLVILVAVAAREKSSAKKGDIRHALAIGGK